MNGLPGIDLGALVEVFVELSLAPGIAIIRCPAPPPAERLAFELFRRRWRHGAVGCQFTQPDIEVN